MSTSYERLHTLFILYTLKTFFLCFVPQENQKYTNASASCRAEQSQRDLLKPPEKLPCAQCRRFIKATPKVIQKQVCVFYYVLCHLTLEG